MSAPDDRVELALLGALGEVNGVLLERLAALLGVRVLHPLAEHLETVPPREWRVGDAVFHEMDVEAILARKPQVVLVDELAHTNADGSKNDKRYSDRIETVTVDSVFDWLQRAQLAGPIQRL